MILHYDKIMFESLLYECESSTGIDYFIIEKDYYVTLFLKELNKRVPNLLFKGGTSLSKCYKIIDRFSEDIDLSLVNKTYTQGDRRRLKSVIIDLCCQLNLNIDNLENIRSRRDFNRYEINYKSNYSPNGLYPKLLVETVFFAEAYPINKKDVTSIIYDYLIEKKDYETIEKYDLFPFEINVQSLERTLIDKIYALCDYAISNKIYRHSRHLYDIHMILPLIDINDDFIKLFNEVRNKRSKYDFCYSAKENINLKVLLNQIIDDKIYYSDYVNVTEKLLTKKINYDEVIESLKNILNSNLFK